MEYITTIYFDAADDADALTIMQGWGLPAGARVTSQVSAQPVSAVVGADGSLTSPEPPIAETLPADEPDEPAP